MYLVKARLSAHAHYSRLGLRRNDAAVSAIGDAPVVALAQTLEATQLLDSLLPEAEKKVFK